MFHQLKAAKQRAIVWSKLQVLKDVTFGAVEKYEQSPAATHNLSIATRNCCVLENTQLRSVKNS